MAYFNEIDKHIKNSFNNHADVQVLDNLPSKSELSNIDRNKLYKVNFAAIAVDVVGFKSMSKNTDDSIFNIIMNEFIHGVVKIMKVFHTPSRIEIQGDSVYAIYRVDTKADIDNIFATTSSLNTFQNNLQKRIDKKFPGGLKKNIYSYNQAKFEFGIGASFSYDNFISVVGHGADTDMIFMGHALNCASALSKVASRNGKPDILIDELVQFNLTDEKKTRIKDIGGMNIVYGIQSTYNEKIYGLNWINTNYNNYVKNNI